MGPPPAWGAPPEPPPPPPERPAGRPGVSKAGIPLARRGGLLLDGAAFTSMYGERYGTSLDVTGSLPLTDRSFFDGILPVGFPAVATGNPMLGVRYVASLSKRAWLDFGGSLGVPLLSEDAQILLLAAIARAFWNAHHYTPDVLPLRVGAGFEWHGGPVELRIQADPIPMFPVRARDEVELLFQHAVELQVGHGIGGGLRLQGVASTGRDAYQTALEPFLSIERDLVFLRTGLVLPLDEALGPPFSTKSQGSWGFRLATGVRVD